jgi:hypothetical protein
LREIRIGEEWIPVMQDSDRGDRIDGWCFAVFDGRGGEPRLADLAYALLARQRREWPALARGYDALASARVRRISGDGWEVQVQFNPARIVSSGARVDPESLKSRPCFLCRENLPPEQRAIRYRDDFLVLCNPAPIFPAHFTIASVRHTPQSLAERLGTLLRLAADFGPRMTVFYNGPACGASAPDHLHFQATPAGLMPVEAELGDLPHPPGQADLCGAAISRAQGLGRGMVVIAGDDERAVAAAAEKAIGALGLRPAPGGEPLLNALCTRGEAGWRLILFPRRKHRPDAYFREGAAKLLISPGAVDMGGILITPREEDFLALTPALVREIYREVAFDDDATEALLAQLSKIPAGFRERAPAASSKKREGR